MQAINSGANVTDEFKTMWRGIGDSEHNTRKVRSGKLRDYLDKLHPETLEYCLNVSMFHLPPELRIRYFSDIQNLGADEI